MWFESGISLSRVHLEPEPAVATEQLQHVVEEADPGVDADLAAAVAASSGRLRSLGTTTSKTATSPAGQVGTSVSSRGMSNAVQTTTANVAQTNGIPSNCSHSPPCSSRPLRMRVADREPFLFFGPLTDRPPPSPSWPTPRAARWRSGSRARGRCSG